MADLNALVGTLAASFVVAAAPGPATLALATTAMRAGRAVALSFGLGLSLGLAAWGVVAASGLGALLETGAVALTVLKLVGGAYLLWLAFGSARDAMSPGASAADAEAGVKRALTAGLMLNLSNPKAVFAWLAALTLSLDSEGGALLIAAATALCACIGVAIYAAYALLFSTRGARAIYARAARWISGVAAACFTAAGVGVLRSVAER